MVTAQYPDGAVIDEIQRVPDLLSYIQVQVDENQQPGYYIVTGSHSFELMNTISQSLASRTALVKLLPFSFSEAYNNTKNLSLEHVLYTGFYPRIFNMGLNPTEAMSFYISTYVERGLRMLINVKDLSRFGVFLKLCAGRTGQVLNLSSIGDDCGVNHNTVKSWIYILEASFIIKLLQPYYKNFNKRLIKAPKLYFIDSGMAAFLFDIQNEIQLNTHPLKGALFEIFIVSELLKKSFNQSKIDNLYYFRDNRGSEVDIILDHGHFFNQVEIKSSQTISSDFFRGLDYLKRISRRVKHSYLIYGGNESRIQQGVSICGWKNIGALEIDKTI